MPWGAQGALGSSGGLMHGGLRLELHFASRPRIPRFYFRSGTFCGYYILPTTDQRCQHVKPSLAKPGLEIAQNDIKIINFVDLANLCEKLPQIAHKIRIKTINFSLGGLGQKRFKIVPKPTTRSNRGHSPEMTTIPVATDCIELVLACKPSPDKKVGMSREGGSGQLVSG